MNIDSTTAASPTLSAGLTSEEAEKLLKQFGPNELKTSNGFKLFELAARQFMSPLVLILLIAAFVSFNAGLIKDTYLILGILVLNAALGFWQEFKAERALQALKKITVSKTRVIRNGFEQEVANKDLVPGDLLVLSAGDIVPADSFLLLEQSL